MVKHEETGKTPIIKGDEQLEKVNGQLIALNSTLSKKECARLKRMRGLPTRGVIAKYLKGNGTILEVGMEILKKGNEIVDKRNQEVAQLLDR